MYGNRFISALSRLWLTVMVCPAFALAVTLGTAVFLAASCNEQIITDYAPLSEDLQSAAPAVTSEVTVEFNILDPDSVPGTKAGIIGVEGDDEDKVNDDDYWTGKTPAENTINRIHLFVVKVDEYGNDAEVEAAVEVPLVAGDYTSTGVRCGHTFELSPGIKRFYVGANMNENHVNAFKAGEPIKADSYEAAIGMVMTDDPTHEGQGTDIVMVSKPATEGSVSDIDITGRSSYYLTARLKRVVSKVLVLAHTDVERSNGERYINYSGTGGGWFRTDDARYILNYANKSTYLKEIPDPEGGKFNVDPNWNLSDWVKLETVMKNGVSSLAAYERNMSDHAGNFSVFGSEDILDRLNDTEISAVVQEYNADYLGNANPAHYIQGLYCLENTVNDDLCTDNVTLRNDAAWLSTTHVYIKMMFRPKTIYTYGSITASPSGPKTAEDIESAVKLTTYYNDDKVYPDGTFFTKPDETTGELEYYNYLAARYLVSEGTAAWSDFTLYEGGTVYFRSFIEGGDAEDPEGTVSYENDASWGIRRNDYCILTIEGVNSWGDPEPGEAYIKTYSMTMPWTKKGETTVTIAPHYEENN